LRKEKPGQSCRPGQAETDHRERDLYFVMNFIIERFKNQRLSARIIDFNKNPGNVPELRSRQSHCMRTLANRSLGVDMWKSEGDARAHFRGVQTCGSPWACPVCAVLISEFRKKEISELIKKALAAGYHLYMITYTLPHYIQESCQLVNDRFMSAMNKMKSQKILKNTPYFTPFSTLLKQYGCDGYVTTKEPLFGQNGWHIHTHGLYIFEKPLVNLSSVRESLWECWLKACDLTFQIGDYPDHVIRGFYKRSVRLDHLTGDAEKIISEYMTKSGVVRKEKTLSDWRMEHELTKGHLKKSESGSLTPFGMLDKIRELSPHDKLSKYLKQKYFEYTETFKGSSFVRWSPGLRKKFGFQEISDQEITDSTVKDVESFYTYFEKPEWYNTILPLGLRGYIQQNSDLPWNDLAEKLNQEIRLRKEKLNNKINHEIQGCAI
jgi:hypothetical protein